MSDRITASLAAWIRSQMVGDPPCRLLTIKHTRAGGQGGTLGKVKIKAESSPEELATIIVADCEADASAWAGTGSGKQTYVVYSYGEGSTDQIARRSIAIVSADIEGEDGAGPTEDASARGLVAQAMRHAEAFARSSQAAFEMSARMMQTYGEAMSQRNSFLESVHQQALEAMTAAQLQLAAAEAEAVADNTKGELMQRALAFAEQIAPVVLAKMAEEKKNGSS